METSDCSGIKGEQNGDTNVYLIVVKGTFRFRLKISTSMEISEITNVNVYT